MSGKENMKKTIKQLEQELDDMREEKLRYYTKYRELEDEKEKNKTNQMMRLNSERDELSNQVRNLLEIIRWQIKPDTAKSPFMPDKDQRDEQHGNRF